MIKLLIDNQLIEYSRDLLKRVNYGKRGEADGNQSEQLRGLTAQCMIMDLLGHDLPKESEGHDGGIDLNYEGLTIDIKTMGRECDPKPNFVNNVIGLQSHYNVDAYIFSSINRTDYTLTICGWILKQDFLRLATFTPKGGTRRRSDGTTFITKADLYEIPNHLLNDVNTVYELKQSLKAAKGKVNGI